MAGLAAAVQLDEVARGAGRAATVGDRVIAFFNVDGEIFAIDDPCVRCGASLADGALAGHTVTCSGCGWRYDVKTGAVVALPSLRVETYEVEIVDAKIFVALTWAPRA